MGKLFGTDGVRGIANSELTPKLAFELGRAAAYVITKEKKSSAKIIIGMDTRISCSMLECALIAGMCSVGTSVHTAGVVPTPAISFLVRKHGFDAGVVISASHNPVADNGIKFFNSDGYKLSDALENEIEDILFNGEHLIPNPIGAEVGTKIVFEAASDDYVNDIVSVFDDRNVTFKGMKVALDCANGATFRIAPLVFEKLGAEVLVINNTPDGININKDCGSTHMDALAQFVKHSKADIGVAYDGDGDRCLVVDENGKLLDGDEIMSICGCYMKEKNMLKKNTIVATVMSNLGLFMMGEQNSITIEQANVGDRYVLEKMLDGGYSFGGEQSGHIIFLDYNTTGDGLFASLMLISIMAEKNQKLSQLNSKMEVLPQVLVNARVKPENKDTFASVDEIKLEITALEEKFNGQGRVLIRPSGTESLIRVMIEGRDTAVLHAEASKLATLIENLLG